MSRLALVGWLLLAALSAQAAVETFEFSSPELRERYQVLVERLRCPKCQNQNLAGSDSPISTDLRREIYILLEEGHSDQQIIDFLVVRYGTFILYDPPKTGTTRWVWLIPGLFLLVGVVLIGMVLKSASGRPVPPATSEEFDP